MLKFTRLIIASIMAVFSIGVAQAYDELVLNSTQTWASSSYATFTPTADGTLTITATNGGSNGSSPSIMYGSSWTQVYFGYLNPGESSNVEIPVSAGAAFDLFFSGGNSDITYIASTGGGGGATEPDGTEANPYILTAEGVACPKKASGYSDFTYYKYVADEAGVVTISHEMTSSYMGGISVNGADFTYNPSGMFVVNANDVIVVRVASENDASAKKIKAVWSALKNGQTKATATTLNSGSNTISKVDNSHAVIPEWYMLKIPGKKTATITFGSEYIVANVWDGDDKSTLSLDENKKWEFTNSNVGEKTIYFEVSGTNNYAITANIAFTDASAGAKFTHLGDVAWSVQNNKLPEAASYITVTFPNAQGGEDTTPVKLENVYIYDEEAGGAPLNLDGTTEFSGNLGNGVNIYYNFELNHEYRVYIRNATVNGTYHIPSANEYVIGNGIIVFYVGEKQQVEAEEIELCSASMNGVSAGNTLSPMSRYVDLETFMPGLTKVADASKIYFVHQGTGWAANVSSAYVSSANGTTVTIDLGSNVADVLTFEGDWTLTLSAGALSDNSGNHINKEASFTWTCGQAADTPKAPTFVSVTNNGKEPSTVKTLSNKFVVTFSTPVQAGYDYAKPTLYYNGYTDSWQASSVVYDGNTATYTFDGADLTKAGTYKLNLTYGIVANAERSDLMFEGYSNDLVWIVSASGEDPKPDKFNITSVLNGNAEGAAPDNVGALNYQFTIKLGEKAYASTGSGNITLTKDGEPYGGNATMIAYPEMTEIYARFSFNNANEIHDAGTYVLTIPEGYLVNADGEVNAAWTGTWTVIKTAHAIDSQVATPGPAQGLDELDNVFTLSGEDWNVIGEAIPYMQIYRNNDITTVNGVASVVNGIATITFPEKFTKGGTYTLYVPASTFLDIDDNYNGICHSTWTVYGKADAFTGYQALNISKAGFMDADQIANGVKVELPNADEGDYVNAELYDANGEKIDEGLFVIDADNIVTFKFDTDLEAGNDYTLKLISIADAEGTVIKTPETVEISFSILKRVITYKLGEVQWNNIAEGALTGAMADGVKISLIDGEGYDEKATVKVSATLNGEEKQFEGTPEGVVLFAGKLTEGKNTIVITSVEVFVDENPVVGMAYGETIEKTFTASSTAGIAVIIAENGNAPMFNIAGQRINVAKGIVIINGKKYQVK